MERRDNLILDKSDTRTLAFDQFGTHRNQQVFDISPRDGPGHRCAEDCSKRLSLLAVHASIVRAGFWKCKRVLQAVGRGECPSD